MPVLGLKHTLKSETSHTSKKHPDITHLRYDQS